jgi:hypothetical protein
MKNKLLSFVLLTLSLTGAGAQAIQQEDRQNDEVIVYRLPEPRQVFILRGDNNVVYKASIPAASIVNNSFILPDNARTESLAIYQDGKRIHTFTTFTADVVVVLRRGEMPRQVKVIQVHVPGLKAASPLEVVYGVRDSGLTWDFLLDLEVTDGGNLNSTLIAQIVAAASLPETTRLILAREPEIILTAASNALLEDSSVYFNLGKQLLEAGKRQLIKVEEGTTKYNIVYRWDANRSERPSAFLRAQNPLKTMAGNVRLAFNSGGIFISGDGTRMSNISPDRPFDLQIGEQPNIITYKSLVTAEFPNRENLPFTHSFEYQVENNSSRAIDLEIEIPVAIGNRHRTEYHFTKEPDERPGGSMLWRYTVAPNQKIELKFSYDADLRNDPSYNRFNYYEGGR